MTCVQVELSGERCRSEEVRGRLEGEVQDLRERLREKTEKLVSAENALLTSRQQVLHYIIPITSYQLHHTNYIIH